MNVKHPFLPPAAALGLLLAGPATALPGVGRPDPLAPEAGVPASQMPGPLRQVGYDQRLGERVPPGLAFADERGRPVRLGDLLGRRPVVLALVYYECPMLCDLVMNGLTGSLKALTFDAGEEFDVVVVSFDPRETPAQAAEARRQALARYGRSGTEAGWHFLTGEQPAIDELTRAVGFRYTYDPQTGQFAHAAGIVVLTPAGRISRYLFGIEYPPRDVRLALVESAGERIGSLVDQLLLYCFHYDPATGSYSAVALNILRLAAAATVAALALMVAVFLRRERLRAAQGTA